TKLTLNDDVATCRARVGNHAFKQRNILIHRQLRAIDDYRIYARVDGFLSFLEAVGVIGIKKYLYSLLAIQVDERARMREREKFALAFAEARDDRQISFPSSRSNGFELIGVRKIKMA